MLPSKNIQGGARVKVDDLAMEDLIVCRNSTSAKLYGSFPQFLVNLHGQRACQRKGDCKKVGSISFASRDRECDKTDRKQRGRRER